MHALDIKNIFSPGKKEKKKTIITSVAGRESSLSLDGQHASGGTG